MALTGYVAGGLLVALGLWWIGRRESRIYRMAVRGGRPDPGRDTGRETLP